MKKLITLLLILFSINALSQDYKILQINSKWNYKNNVKLPARIEGVRVDYALLEDQQQSLQDKIKSVPVVILYKENKVIKKWSADISFKLDVKAWEIAEAIKEDEQKLTRRKTN